MAGKYDPQGIPDLGITLPPGNVVFRLESLDDSEATSTGKYQIKATLRVVEPTDLGDSPFFERFVIGTDTDLAADDPLSWRGFAAQRYRDMVLKMGMALTGTIEGDAAILTGQIVGATIKNEVQAATNRDGSANRYAGNIQARVGSWFRVGERVVGDAPSNGGAAPAPAAPAPAPALTKPPAAKPAAKATPAPAAEPLVMCGLCNPAKQIPKSLFGAHVKAHEDEE